MKCLVINLDRSADRLAHVSAEFARIGIDFERFAAVDASATSAIRQLTKLEVACFLSHRACWQMIADGPDKFCAVFEDDVVFSQDAGRLLRDGEWVPSDADVVKLETFLVRVRLAPKHVSIRDGYSIARLVGRHLGSAGYILSKRGAQKLLRGTTHLKGTIDYALFSPTLMSCSRNTIYQLVPALCIQSNLILGDDRLPSLIQLEPPSRKARITEKILGEASRTFAHLRNRSLLRSMEMGFIPFRRQATAQE